MSQEFVIKSQSLEDKVNQLLPSQSGAAAGVDLSASSMIVPIIDLTESAEGSKLRQDLQTSFSLLTEDDSVSGAVTTIINTTGFYRLYGHYRTLGTSAITGKIQITDGITTKDIFNVSCRIAETIVPFDFNILLKAGDSCVVNAQTNVQITVASRQIADINGNLINP